jgi:putative membrane protein
MHDHLGLAQTRKLIRTLPYNPSMTAADKPVEQDPRVYFAAERTFLAWIRTGLALMGIGFAVSRFGLFLRQVTAAESHLPANTRTTGLSLWSGVALVALGVIVTLGSALRHVQLIHQLSSGTWLPGKVSRDAIVLGLILAAIGIGMAAYLMLVR